MYRVPGVEIFATGRYRGSVWDLADLDQMAKNARLLGPSGKNLLRPPVVYGHEEQQEFLDRTDWPAAGWLNCDTVRVRRYRDADTGKIEGILIGDFEDVNPVTAAALKSKRYRKVSSEIYDDFASDHGQTFGKTLRRIALLGGDLPQVKRLKDVPQPISAHSECRHLVPGDAVRTAEGTWICFAEAVGVDRNQLTAAVKAGLPNLSNAFLDGLTDDKLAELVKSVPTPEQPQPQAAPVTPPGMPAQPVAPMIPPDPYSQEFADMSREELVAALTEMGQDAAELEAMPDEELQALYDELKAEADGGGGAVEEMGDPATMSREEMIAELAGAGQDPAALEAMPDEELRALYAQVTGGATAAAPAAAPVVPMSEKTKPTQTVQKESAKLLKNLQKLNTFAERENRRLKAVAQQAKRRDAESFCEQLVKDGRVTVAQATAFVKPLLLLLDDSHPVHKFTEGGVTRKLSAFALKKRELAKLAPVIRFGERLSSDAPDGEAEVQKVEKFAEQVFPNPKARAKYVAEFKALKAAKPELTAKDYGVNPVHA
jgi:hypothetical protein